MFPKDDKSILMPRALEYRLYIEGIEFPLIGGQVVSGQNSTRASVSVPPIPEIISLPPKSIMHITYRDSYSGWENEWLLFEGEYVGYSMSGPEDSSSINLSANGIESGLASDIFQLVVENELIKLTEKGPAPKPSQAERGAKAMKATVAPGKNPLPTPVEVAQAIQMGSGMTNVNDARFAENEMNKLMGRILSFSQHTREHYEKRLNLSGKISIMPYDIALAKGVQGEMQDQLQAQIVSDMASMKCQVMSSVFLKFNAGALLAAVGNSAGLSTYAISPPIMTEDGYQTNIILVPTAPGLIPPACNIILDTIDMTWSSNLLGGITRVYDVFGGDVVFAPMAYADNFKHKAQEGDLTPVECLSGVKWLAQDMLTNGNLIYRRFQPSEEKGVEGQLKDLKVNIKEGRQRLAEQTYSERSISGNSCSIRCPFRPDMVAGFPVLHVGRTGIATLGVAEQISHQFLNGKGMGGVTTVSLEHARQHLIDIGDADYTTLDHESKAADKESEIEDYYSDAIATGQEEVLAAEKKLSDADLEKWRAEASLASARSDLDAAESAMFSEIQKVDDYRALIEKQERKWGLKKWKEFDIGLYVNPTMYSVGNMGELYKMFLGSKTVFSYERGPDHLKTVMGMARELYSAMKDVPGCVLFYYPYESGGLGLTRQKILFQYEVRPGLDENQTETFKLLNQEKLTINRRAIVSQIAKLFAKAPSERA